LRARLHQCRSRLVEGPLPHLDSLHELLFTKKREQFGVVHEQVELVFRFGD
jgi:hypothetical protein